VGIIPCCTSRLRDATARGLRLAAPLRLRARPRIPFLVEVRPRSLVNHGAGSTRVFKVLRNEIFQNSAVLFFLCSSIYAHREVENKRAFLISCRSNMCGKAASITPISVHVRSWWLCSSTCCTKNYALTELLKRTVEGVAGSLDWCFLDFYSCPTMVRPKTGLRAKLTAHFRQTTSVPSGPDPCPPPRAT
jgi:hypothetical protein